MTIICSPIQTVLKAHDVQYMMNVLLRKVKTDFVSRYQISVQAGRPQEIETFLELHKEELKKSVGLITRDILFTIALNDVDDREAIITYVRQAFGYVNERLRQRLHASLCSN